MIDRLRSHLDPIARDTRSWQLWRALAACWAALALIGLFFLATSMAHSAVPFWSLIVVGVIISCAIGWRYRTTPPDYIALARQIEQETPELHSVLLTAVEQVPTSPTGELNYLQQRVVEEALQHARQSSWGRRNAQRRALMFSAHWVCLFLFAVALFAIRPTSRTHRQNDIWAEVERSGGVAVTPGDTNLERGSGLVVLVRFENRLPAEATLVIQSTNHNERRIALAKNLSDPVFGGALAEVKDDLKYHIEYGDHHTRDYKVGVFEFPKLERADATITYPAYTGLPAKTIKDTRRVSAVEGSTLDYTFYLNKRVTSAQLVERDKSSTIPLIVDATNATVYHSRFVIDQGRRYELLLSDEAGRTNRQPPEFVIEALKNRPAELKLVTPRGDLRVSPLEEIPFQAEASADFGVKSYGVAYQLGDGETKVVELGGKSAPHEKKQFNYLLPLESLHAQPDQLLSYYIWADDLGADGKIRRTTSDLFFAEIRPFDEIFREGQPGDPNPNNAQKGQQQNGQNQSPSEKLSDLQKQIMSATWNLQRRETATKPSPQYKADATVVRDSQEQALTQAKTMIEKIDDARLKGFAQAAEKSMEKASAHLKEAADKNTLTTLSPALTDEQSAYQSLLRLQAREYQVAKNNSRSQRAQRSGQGRQRSQDQIDQLDLKQTENRYKTENEATPAQTPAQRENLQVANRLKELAQRQQNLNDKLKELQTALQEAKTETERDEIRDRLKRLRDEQQDMLADVDELRQRMDRPENQSSMSEERQQLDKTRAEVQRASEALNQDAVPKALSSGTRAQRDLQQLQDDVRKKNSSQFAEEMRQMRDKTRQMAQKQDDIAKKLDEVSDPKHKTLSDSDERRDLANQLNQQEDALTNIYTDMRRVSEQSETTEPLLSKELYDVLRRSSPDDVKKQLEMSAELVKRGFAPQATESEQKARQQIDDLNKNIERAAESVLGDDTEALRLARKELQDLTEQLDKELAQASGEQKTNDILGSTNGLAGARQRGNGGSNDIRQASGGRSGTNSNNGAATAGQRGNQQAANGQNPGRQPGRGNNPNGQSPGQQDQLANQDSQPAGQPGQSSGQRGQRGQPGQGQGQGGSEQPPNDQVAQNPRGNGAGQRNGAGGRGASAQGGGFNNGPLIGENFVNWSDRLRNVEEMIDSPDLQTEVARIRDRARVIRQEYIRNQTRPDWAVVKTQLSAPLAEVRARVDEELARRASKEAVVPLDRDPVPAQYSERVKRYYEQLGKNE